MPTYQYACTACDHRFEAVQAFTDDSLTVCPECGGSAAQGLRLGRRGLQGQRLLPDRFPVGLRRHRHRPARTSRVGEKSGGEKSGDKAGDKKAAASTGGSDSGSSSTPSAASSSELVEQRPARPVPVRPAAARPPPAELFLPDTGEGILGGMVNRIRLLILLPVVAAALTGCSGTDRIRAVQHHQRHAGEHHRGRLRQRLVVADSTAHPAIIDAVDKQRLVVARARRLAPNSRSARSPAGWRCRGASESCRTVRR